MKSRALSGCWATRLQLHHLAMKAQHRERIGPRGGARDRFGMVGVVAHASERRGSAPCRTTISGATRSRRRSGSPGPPRRRRARRNRRAVMWRRNAARAPQYSVPSSSSAASGASPGVRERERRHRRTPCPASHAPAAAASGTRSTIRWQRLVIVGSSCCGRCVTSRKCVRGRRLFQAFQQRVRGVRVERFGGMHEHDLAAAAVARHVDEIRQRADLVDFDLRLSSPRSRPPRPSCSAARPAR